MFICFILDFIDLFSFYFLFTIRSIPISKIISIRRLINYSYSFAFWISTLPLPFLITPEILFVRAPFNFLWESNWFKPSFPQANQEMLLFQVPIEYYELFTVNIFYLSNIFSYCSKWFFNIFKINSNTKYQNDAATYSISSSSLFKSIFTFVNSQVWLFKHY